jgi:hypothetical protein
MEHKLFWLGDGELVNPKGGIFGLCAAKSGFCGLIISELFVLPVDSTAFRILQCAATFDGIH